MKRDCVPVGLSPRAIRGPRASLPALGFGLALGLGASLASGQPECSRTDADADGAVTMFDVLSHITDFESGTDNGDFNRDGAVDGDDLRGFVACADALDGSGSSDLIRALDIDDLFAFQDSIRTGFAFFGLRNLIEFCALPGLVFSDDRERTVAAMIVYLWVFESSRIATLDALEPAFAAWYCAQPGLSLDPVCANGAQGPYNAPGLRPAAGTARAGSFGGVTALEALEEIDALIDRVCFAP